MENYIINLTGFGIDDSYIEDINITELKIKRKGDIWNKRTGKKYEENIIRISSTTQYEEGFGPAVDNILCKLETISLLSNLFLNCRYVELQLCIFLDDSNRVPSIHISLEQLQRLSKFNANIDVDIN